MVRSLGGRTTRNLSRLAAFAFLMDALVAVAMPALVENDTATVDGYPQVVYEFEVGRVLWQPPLVLVNDAGVTMTAVVEPAPSSDALAVVIAVDVSRSMVPYMAEVQAAVRRIIEELPAYAQVGIVTFHSDIESRVPFTSDRAVLIRTIGEMDAVGNRTELYYGVHEALELFRRLPPGGRRYVLVVSDGKDEGGAYTLDGNLKQAGDLSALILGLGVEVSGETNWRTLKRLADESGGAYARVLPDGGTSAYGRFVRESLSRRWRATWITQVPRDSEVQTYEITVDTKQGESVSRSVSVAMPRLPVTEPGRPWWHWTIVGGLLLLIVLTTVLLVRWSRARREDAPSLEVVSVPEYGEFVEPLILAQPSHDDGTVFEVQKSEAPARASLTLLTNGQRHVFAMRGSRIRVGRSADNDIVIQDDRMSRHHFEVRDAGGVFFLEDLSSANGVYAGRERVRGSVALAHGIEVRAGGATFEFRHGVDRGLA